MAEKRFNSYCDNDSIRIRIDDNNEEIFHIYFTELEDAVYCKSKLNPLLDVLNKLAEENEQLKTKNNAYLQDIEIFKEDVTHSNLQINKMTDENEQLKKDVDYWKQIASQYSNELNVFEHCKKYKTECKDIHWSSD